MYACDMPALCLRYACDMPALCLRYACEVNMFIKGKNKAFSAGLIKNIMELKPERQQRKDFDTEKFSLLMN